MRRRAALGLALAALAAPVLAADRAAELEALRRAIEERRQRVEDFEREQRGLLDALEAVDRSTAEMEADALRRRGEVEEASAAQREAEARLPELAARLARTRAGMKGRVVALYKTGTLGPAQMLFSSQSLRDLLERVDALGRLLAYDRTLVARYRGEEQALAEARRAAVETRARQATALAALRERREELDRERGVKRQLLASVAGDRAREQAALAELEAAARALEETLAKLGEAPEALPTAPSGPSFAALRGQLPSPVEAPIVRGFGKQVDAQFQTQILHKGVDFGAERGAPVHAVAAGRVRFAGWFRGYGRIVILDHGDRFYTVSGHLDEIGVEVGDEVEAGAPIGTVGDTGSLSGARLYFEIREGGAAVDPAAWLRG